MIQALESLLDWFAGGSRNYMRLDHCLDHDYLWIAITILLDLAVVSGYLLIAFHWWKNQRLLQPGAAKTALGNMRNIFVYCGLCGYVFIPVKMVWPAWRLYDIFLLLLAVYTWRYAWGARQLNVVYGEIGRSKELEEALRASRADSRRRTLFLNALSHDLRTPLNVVMMQARLARVELQNGASREDVGGALDRIEASVLSMGGLLDGLLELGKLDWEEAEVSPSRFPLAGLLDELEAEFRESAEKKSLYFQVEASDGIEVHTDRTKLFRVLRNLVDNALKFTAKGGVRLEARETAAGGVKIDVVDSGIGIPDGAHQHVFDEFVQLENWHRDARHGLGLGLPIAARIARQLGGDLSLDSRVGKGSRFSLTLPRELHACRPAGPEPLGKRAGAVAR